jgi:putative hemolysin
VDGLLNIEDFADETGVVLPDGPYETAAGYVIARLGHLPAVGEFVDVNGRRLEVVGLDGRRVSRLRLSPPTPAASSTPAADQPEADPVGPDGPRAADNGQLPE